MVLPHTWHSERGAMLTHLDWLIPGIIGVTFTLVGVLKFVGLYRGIVGGVDKPFLEKLCGS